MSRVPLAVLSIALLAPTLPASVHVVDDDGGAGVNFTSISAAVAAAVDGDIILVKNGSYTGFTLDDLGVVITADLGHAVQVNGQVVVKNLAAAKAATISGVDVNSNSSGEAVLLQSNVGSVFFERATIVGSGIQIFQTAIGLSASQCADVTIVDCSISVAFGAGGVSGLDLVNTSAHVYNSSLSGGAQPIETLPGGAGCRVFGGFLFAAGTSFQGGQGGDGALQPPFGICTDGGMGGAGLQLVGGADAKIVDSSFAGGAGGAPGGPLCVAGPTGPGQDLSGGTLYSFPWPARTYDIPSPAREGTNGFISLAGDPGEFVWVFFSFVQTPTYAHTIKGTLLPGTPNFIIFFGALPASGVLSATVPVPIHPSALSFALVEQAVYFTQAKGFQVSNPRLGIVLDQSL